MSLEEKAVTSRGISFYYKGKSPFCVVERMFKAFERTFNVVERTFNVVERTFNDAERRFLLIV